VPLCQPCNAYFHGQVKKYTEKSQNCLVLTAANRQLSSREDCKNACTSIYRNTVRNAWCAAKLITSREVLCNVNQVGFPAEVETEECEYSNKAFVRCSRCRKFLCCIAFKMIPSGILQACLRNLMRSILF
jgi:hypothetical protein